MLFPSAVMTRHAGIEPVFFSEKALMDGERMGSS